MSTKPLADMTIDELRQLKQDWWADPKRRHYYDRLGAIARTLGRSTNATHQAYRHLDGDMALRIEFDAYGRLLSVYSAEQLVYSTSSQLVVPGDWEDCIPLLEAEAKRLADERQQESREHERQNLIRELSGSLRDPSQW